MYVATSLANYVHNNGYVYVCKIIQNLIIKLAS